MSLPIPAPPGSYYEYEGTVPSAETLIQSSAKTVRIYQLILTNISAGDITVTMKNNEGTPVTEAAFIVSANDQIAPTFEGGWKFKSGIRVSDGDGTAVRIQIKGFKEY